MSSVNKLTAEDLQKLLAFSETLGEGKFGEVSLVRSGSFSHNILKKLKRNSSAELFMREQFFLKVLDGVGGAPRLLGVCDNPRALLTTDEGPFTLFDVLKECKIPDWYLCIIGVEIGLRLREIHRKGVVHDDLHSGNVIVNLPSDTSQHPDVRLIDFGLAGIHKDGLGSLCTDEYRSEAKWMKNWMSTPHMDVQKLGSLLGQILVKMTVRPSALEDIIDKACECTDSKPYYSEGWTILDTTLEALLHVVDELKAKSSFPKPMPLRAPWPFYKIYNMYKRFPQVPDGAVASQRDSRSNPQQRPPVWTPPEIPKTVFSHSEHYLADTRGSRHIVHHAANPQRHQEAHRITRPQPQRLTQPHRLTQSQAGVHTTTPRTFQQTPSFSTDREGQSASASVPSNSMPYLHRQNSVYIPSATFCMTAPYQCNVHNIQNGPCNIMPCQSANHAGLYYHHHHQAAVRYPSRPSNYGAYPFVFSGCYNHCISYQCEANHRDSSVNNCTHGNLHTEANTRVPSVNRGFNNSLWGEDNASVPIANRCVHSVVNTPVPSVNHGLHAEAHTPVPSANNYLDSEANTRVPSVDRGVQTDK